MQSRLALVFSLTQKAADEASEKTWKLNDLSAILSQVLKFGDDGVRNSKEDMLCHRRNVDSSLIAASLMIHDVETQESLKLLLEQMPSEEEVRDRPVECNLS